MESVNLLDTFQYLLCMRNGEFGVKFTTKDSECPVDKSTQEYQDLLALSSEFVMIFYFKKLTAFAEFNSMVSRK